MRHDRELPPPPAGSLDELAAASFIIYYHTLHEARGLTPPRALPEPFALAGLDEAVEALRRALEGDVEQSSLAARLALSQLFRARAWRARRGLDAAPARPLDGAILALLEAFEGWAARRAGRRGGDGEPLACRAARLHDAVGGDRAARAGQDFFHAFELLRPPGARELRRYALSWSYADEVTDVTARVEVKRPLESFMRAACDPREWSRALPWLWRASEEVERVPRDRGCDGAAARRRSGPGQPFVLFEKAVFSIGLLPVATYRNYLNVTLFDGAAQGDGGASPAPRRRGFVYSQNLCASTDFLLFGRRYGGIDVDQGHVLCEALEHGWCRAEGRKRARFDQPSGALRRVYNDLASVYLLFLIEGLVLLGAEL